VLETETKIFILIKLSYIFKFLYISQFHRICVIVDYMKLRFFFLLDILTYIRVFSLDNIISDSTQSPYCDTAVLMCVAAE